MRGVEQTELEATLTRVLDALGPLGIHSGVGCWTLWAHSGFTRVLDALGPLGIHSGATPQNHLSRVPPHSKPPCNKYYLLETTPLEATSLE